MDALEATWGGLLRLLAAVSLLAFGLYCCYIKYVHMKYDYIPGVPRDSFFFGHLPSIWKTLKKKEPISELFLQWSEECGPIVRMNTFHEVILLIFSPEGVKEYLMSPEYPKDQRVYRRFYNLCGVRFLGNGLVTDPNYDHWHKQRKIMDPAFSRTFLMGLMGNFNDKAEELMRILEEKADGEIEVDLMNLLQRVTLDIIAKVAFGLESNSLHDDQVPFPHAVSMIVKGVSGTNNPLFQYLPWNRKVVKEIQESVRLLRRTGKECIEQRRKAMQDGEEIPQDILTQILKSTVTPLEQANQDYFSLLSMGFTAQSYANLLRKEERDCDDGNMLDNFVTFFFAGHETTANQLSFTIMELGRHPEILMRLQAEVDEIVGVKRDINYEDLGKFQYLSQVLKEVLRLYPPNAATVRWTGKEKIIDGVKIPANTTLLFSSYTMGRTEKYFKDALTFNPDRFSKEQQKPYFSYFPFSLGPRSCIGQIFAQMEAKVVMAKFLQKFEFELVPPQSFQILDTGTLRPLDGVVCKLKPRQQSGCED